MIWKAGSECWVEVNGVSFIVGNITGCKPLTPPIELIDGKAYQLTYRNMETCAIYSKDHNFLYSATSIIEIKDCTNIKLLEVTS